VPVVDDAVVAVEVVVVVVDVVVLVVVEDIQNIVKRRLWSLYTQRGNRRAKEVYVMSMLNDIQ
jgi:hypothetical protein